MSAGTFGTWDLAPLLSGLASLNSVTMGCIGACECTADHSAGDLSGGRIVALVMSFTRKFRTGRAARLGAGSDQSRTGRVPAVGLHRSGVPHRTGLSRGGPAQLAQSRQEEAGRWERISAPRLSFFYRSVTALAHALALHSSPTHGVLQSDSAVLAHQAQRLVGAGAVGVAGDHDDVALVNA